jgi:KDO2-lipid IV(A) lauroyltransferase
MKKLSQLLSYLVLRFACFVLLLLPLRLSYLLAQGIGYLGYHVFRFRRNIVMENLQTAFGREMNDRELTALAARSYQQIAMTFLELMIAPKMQKQFGQILQPKHRQMLQELLRQEHGLVTISGHLGNWEFQGAAVPAGLSEPFTVAAVQQSNPYINRFITKRRNGMGMQVAGTKEAMKLLVRALRNREAIGMVADQSAAPWVAVFVDFFGKTAATMPGPAQLALKYGAPMVVGAAVRTGPGRFIMLAQQVEIKPDDTVETLTQRHVKILESFIRQYPDQYFWLHRRWKTKTPKRIEDLKN